MFWLCLTTSAVSAWGIYQVSNYRRRRLLYSSYRRLIRWEFWAMWAFYPPVILYILYMGLRYKSWTLFTVSNPCMPHGGVALMSKSAILEGLMGKPERVAVFIVLHASEAVEDKVDSLATFMRGKELSYPIVLKPDFGERGKGVGIIRNSEDALDYLRGSSETIIAQEYVPGLEYGVFYIRRPGAERGRVTSITAKKPTYVIGNGRSTLERLILNDPRAVCMARFFLAKFDDRLDEVIGDGERFVLAELGTHSRGSLFLDATDVWTEALEAAFDELSRSYEGFYVGRYDVRVDTCESLRCGEGFKVLELNGVVSEPTHIYDPKHGLMYAYKTMFALWKEIFAISAANRDRGNQPSTLGELKKLLREFGDQEIFEV